MPIEVTEPVQGLLYGLNDRPGATKAVLAAAAHLLAIVASIAAAPLIIALGLGLGEEQTSYLIASALTVSGVATFIQVYRFGPLGSGLLSVQGTSFAFVGVFIYTGHMLQVESNNDADVLGVLLGTAAVGGVVTIGLSFFLQRLKSVVTLNVTGVVIFLLGLSLVGVAYNNLQMTVATTVAAGGSGFDVWVQALVVIGAILFFSTRRNVWLKLGSIVLGLIIGMLFTWLTAGIDQVPQLSGLSISVVKFVPFPLGFDLAVFFLLLPIYLVTITESIGDLTATSMLSGTAVQGDAYWQRLRGGVMADGFNTVLASLFGTFPNTTFSQNNGVIRLTGVASRMVGILLAGLLVIFGCIPAFTTLFQSLPGGVLHGATALMFAMIMLAGWRMLADQQNRKRAFTMLAVCSVVSMLLTQAPTIMLALGLSLPDYLGLLFSFPVATGALLAMAWELCTRSV